MRFARSRLAVREHGGVVAVEEIGYERAHACLVQFALRGLGRNGVVEGEALVFANDDLLGLGRDAHARLMLMLLFAAIERSNLK